METHKIVLTKMNINELSNASNLLLHLIFPEQSYAFFSEDHSKSKQNTLYFKLFYGMPNA